jgi:ribosomal protein L37AE/L43A
VASTLKCDCCGNYTMEQIGHNIWRCQNCDNKIWFIACYIEPLIVKSDNKDKPYTEEEMKELLKRWKEKKDMTILYVGGD